MRPITIRDDLPYEGVSHEFEGYRYGDTAASIFFFEGPPGSGPKLHRHPYAELFIIQEGEATFTVGDETIVAVGGQLLIAPAGVAHAFRNTGSGPLRQIDIHLSDRFITEWLED